MCSRLPPHPPIPKVQIQITSQEKQTHFSLTEKRKRRKEGRREKRGGKERRKEGRKKEGKKERRKKRNVNMFLG